MSLINLNGVVSQEVVDDEIDPCTIPELFHKDPIDDSTHGLFVALSNRRKNAAAKMPPGPGTAYDHPRRP